MGMSAWGLFITPLLIATDPNITEAKREQQLEAHARAAPSAIEEDSVFGGLASLNDAAMASASGGNQYTAFDIGNVNANVGENSASVENVTTTNSTNGNIADNIISDNGGITTVFNNTGNGVSFQSIVNVNINLNGAQGPQ